MSARWLITLTETGLVLAGLYLTWRAGGFL
jgi:hypothetical protein